MVIFDIETEGLPLEQILQVSGDFEPPAAPGEFDPASVKYGNTKDGTKRAAILADAQQRHAAVVASHSAKVEELRTAWQADLLADAALSPVTGRVLCIGYYNPEKDKLSIDDGGQGESESAILGRFWSTYLKVKNEGRSMVGLNIFDFDLPFLARRSWINGIDVPETAIDQSFRYWDRVFVDLRRRWLLGQHSTSCKSNFEVIAKALGTPGKNGLSGADFAKLWREDREKAVEYLKGDLIQPAQWCRRMGVVA